LWWCEEWGCGKAVPGQCRNTRASRRHAVERILMRDRDDTDILTLRATTTTARLRSSRATLGLHDDLVAGNVITVSVRVDQEPDRSVGHTSQRCPQSLALTRPARIHHQRPFLPSLHDDVAAGADDQVHVALHRKDLEAVDDERRRRRRQWNRCDVQL